MFDTCIIKHTLCKTCGVMV